MRDVHGKKVTVVGMGQTALAAVQLLKREGALPFVTESSDGPKFDEIRRILTGLGVPFEMGGHTEVAFRDAAFVIPSPGVPPRIPAIERAAANGADVLSELEFAVPYCEAPILAVTGTNGKTTTTEWLRAMIAECGHSVSLAGNNATPLSRTVMEPHAPDYVVLEVSSYQLELIRSFRPWAAAVLNVTPDHAARHGSLENYAAVKARIFENMTEGDHAVVNADDPITRDMAKAIRHATVHRFSLTQPLDAGCWLDGGVIRYGDAEIARRSDVRLPGHHNLENALAALTMTHACRFPPEPVRRALTAFRGVEHRIEPVATINGAGYFNDSKSTNLDSLKVALESFDRPVVLIAGGEGKGNDYATLTGLIRAKVKSLIAIGADAPLIEAAYQDATRVVRAEDMADAVAKAREAAVQGDAVLLSPGCASFDMFDNFEHRGRVFKECVTRLASRDATASCSAG